MNSDNAPQQSSEKNLSDVSSTLAEVFRDDRVVTLSLKQALGAWASGVALVVLPVLFIPLVIFRAHEIFLSPEASNWLELCLFAGAGYLLFFKRGTANMRLTAEVTIWLATASYLAFKYFQAPFSSLVVVAAIVAAFVVAYKRAETGQP